MKTKITAAVIALAALSSLPSCTTVVDPSPAPVTTSATTTTTSDASPYVGTTTHKKTTTTMSY